MKRKIPLILLFVFWAASATADVDTAWVRRYNGSGDSDDYLSAMALDQFGNVYVVGYTCVDSARRYDYVTIRYYQNGDTAWLRIYDGAANGDDIPEAVAIDDAGNVYVTGKSRTPGATSACATVKYDSSGNEVWCQRYSGSAPWPCTRGTEARAITVDESGNAYVTGFTYVRGDDPGCYDYTSYVTAKYSPSGDTHWVRVGPQGIPSDLVVDQNGNIYVTGNSYIVKYRSDGDTAWVRDCATGDGKAMAVDDLGNVYQTGSVNTMKLYPNGDTVWVRRFPSFGNDARSAEDIAVDGSGNVFVTGWAIGYGTYNELITIKYAPDGQLLWQRIYNGESVDNNDVGRALALDQGGNVYSAGYSTKSSTAWDYIVIKYDAGGNDLWLQTYNGQGNWIDEAKAVTVDASGGIYVAGDSYGSGTYEDCATIKYHSNGDTAWIRRYNGPLSNWDWASDIAVDPSGNVCVTGVSYGKGSEWDYITIKYYPDGDTAWLRTYDGPATAHDSASAIAVDSAGNVYVTGYCSAGRRAPIYCDYDMATIKYFPDGDTAWVRTFTYGPYSDDVGYAIAVDAEGNVCVTGEMRNWLNYQRNFITVKYDSLGNQLWYRWYDGPGQWWDVAQALAVDEGGNIYVTGYSEGYYWDSTGVDYATVKYHADGTLSWVRRYNGPEHYMADYPHAIAVDASGSVYLTGASGGDYATIKYDSDGHTAWVSRYNGPGNSDDQALAVALDDWENVYVTGYSIGVGTGRDYATVKYDAAGAEVWVARYDGPANADDAPRSVVVDALGNIYVTGESHGSELEEDYATIKYDAQGNELWVRRYDGPGGKTDAACALAVDHLGNVYLTGRSYGTGTHRDFATVKYDQTASNVSEEPVSQVETHVCALHHNYPNPFNQITQIRFQLARSGFVSLRIYDILGRKVRTLVSEHLSSGHKTVSWDGRNDRGEEVASGIYFCQLKVGDFSETKKLVLLK